MIGKSSGAKVQAITVLGPEEPEGEYITYTVRYGDTIWDIARIYESVTISDILSLNNISDPQKIQVGQKLRIKKKS